MFFSKLSVLVAAAFAAFAAAGPAPSCSSGPVLCCNVMRNANDQDINLAHQKLSLPISAGAAVWETCTDFSQAVPCAGQTVCCPHVSPDLSIAIGCNVV